MRTAVAAVHALVAALVPGDEPEAADRAQALHWLASTDDVFRRVRPATPPRHLVSYVVPMDRAGNLLLVDHILAGLWLPPGGHVEPDEHPARTAEREAFEELGSTAAVEEAPVFLTATVTVGRTAGHTDVSLWFPLRIEPAQLSHVDSTEFRTVRWWSPDELRAADPTRFDPQLSRFLTKLER